MSHRNDQEICKNAIESLIKDTFRHLYKLAQREDITVKRMGQLLPRVVVQILHEQGYSKTKIASLTGYARKSVDKYLAEEDIADETSNITRFVNHWAADPHFPTELSFNGEEPSFVSLFERYGGDLTPGVLLENLLEKGIVSYEKNRVVLLSRTVIATTKVDKIEGIHRALNAIFATLINNIDPETEPFLERRLWSDAIPKTKLPELRQRIHQATQTHRREILDIIAEYQIDTAQNEEVTAPMAGLGLYWFETGD